ncbi:bifunctional adenosylcobinamide kinase/adenosylcobinamide-phosphate guanylyltransferase [Candidatus Synechococcus calcipolaris G9]|uniref:Adenosylcobinamide kinase n=1 Tax=Candidatus Synechococcus calcipolaris G9 TaxID=1497997 RepID=A0ABT6F336_9SYNE|nr:bifunctional adenosylcobinamide kinase/adenosylcobinamide-phosphate guanylyltransferase [Candidatus Synechococcus calcipolaris]MDG2992234.1 bifunctional adenosylcobinamide kinase/adenosylcobinamide-phosphate guanylyltransferase [Candidatus Synechococcus calcipolaris G9]
MGRHIPHLAEILSILSRILKKSSQRPDTLCPTQAGLKTLVTGPARSGKSEWAESLASHTQQSVCYVATAIAHPQDREWQDRIRQHQMRRPPDWRLVEVPYDLSQSLRDNSGVQTCLLIDSLGTWVANTLESSASAWQGQMAELKNTVKTLPGTVIFVAEETSWGVIPAYASGRLFRDRLGGLIQHLSREMDQVFLVAGGYALPLHQLGYPL